MGKVYFAEKRFRGIVVAQEANRGTCNQRVYADRG